MIWLCLSARGAFPPTQVVGNINAEIYIHVLEENLDEASQVLVDADWVFQQDNARPHTAKITQEWFRNKDIIVMERSASSPDLNPVENFWGYIV